MITVAVLDKTGKEVDSLTVDEAVLGGCVRLPLLKQAIVMYHANKHIGTAATKSRGMVDGSTRKIYRQKGTGNARMGNVRTNVRRGGGVAFAKVARSTRKDMPKKQRVLAMKSALLSKLLSGSVVIIDDIKMDAVKTKDFASILNNLKIDRSCLVTTGDFDRNIYLSARNIPKIDVIRVEQINAGDICLKQKVLFTRQAFESLLNVEKN